MSRFPHIGYLGIALALWAGTALASDYADLIRTQESGGNYGALNTQGGTAAGAYQITAGTLASLGYVNHIGGSYGSWSNYEWTSLATVQGVTSLSGFLTSPAGHALQDQAFDTLTTLNLSALSTQTLGLVGQTINGVTFTESGLLTAAHFLGAGALNDWVASGFDPTVFPQSYLDANGFSSYAELQSHLMNRIGAASDTMYAGGTGTGGSFAQTTGFPGFGAKRPILIRETPPFQGERTSLGGTQ
ncbi:MULTISPECIES: hypothetical protein [Rhodobacterales]|uniref:Uncharacterized protein n=1 Tax=Pelagivirga sediminicola TaxID=2170575 RepID=A0A2T7G3Q8_9RHOB|nr:MULTISPECIES: hypothetical protein [Rhodobacterales]MCQ0090350.1 hypothetical protein [Roseovarius sp. M141]PVA09049.1 hypothetical protein DC366_15945 [Pelagivirga sediminicola]